MTRYLTMAECFWLAGQVTGNDPVSLARVSRVELAESAMVAAAVGEWDETAVAAWLRRRVRFA